MHLSPARTLLVACGVLILTNGPVFLVANRMLEQPRSWEEPFTRAVFMSVAIVAVGAVVLDRFRVDGARLVVPNPVAAVAIVWFLVWMVASSAWSLTPELTRGRSLVYVGLAAFAWIIADLEFAAFRRALALAAGVAVGASLAAVVFSDSIGMDVNDDWRGIYTNRNSLAPVAAIAVIVGVGIVFESRGARRVAAGALVLLAAVVLAGSGSRTAWLALLIAMGAAFVVVGARVGGARFGARVRSGILAGGVVGAVIALAVLSRLWGDSTFAQRRTIWSLVRDRIAERPLQGFGWFNVWSDADFVSEHYLLTRGSAHGSFFEVWLGLGLVGLIPFVVIVGLALHGTITDAWRRPSVETWTWLALVSFLVMENLTESFVLWFSYNLVLLMAAALRVGCARRSRPEPRTPAPSEPATV
ncbi:MAG: O-antigen ligase family protein [Acidimicrobiales bacterium]